MGWYLHKGGTQIKPQGHDSHGSFHPREFQGIDFHEKREWAELSSSYDTRM